MARYQQGIGVPEASNVPSTFQAPTTWQEPKAPAINRVDFKPGNTGATRDYGRTPDYVDTVPSRWSYSAKNTWLDKLSSAGESAGSATQSWMNSSGSSRGTDTGPITNPSWSTTQRSRRDSWE